MKKISQEQVQQIINVLFEINAPIKVYAAVKEMLEKLPLIEEEKKDKK